MYNEFMNKSNLSILEYMERLGKDSRIYSEKRRGLGPLLTQYDLYVYATERELALVPIDLGTESEVSPKKELIWDLAFTCELCRNRLLRFIKKIPHVFGVLVTSDLVSDNRATKQLRELLDVEQIYGVKGLDNISIPVNTDNEHPLAFPMMFLYEAEFGESDILYASHHLHSLEEEEESLSQEEIAAEIGINLADFGLSPKTTK